MTDINVETSGFLDLQELLEDYIDAFGERVGDVIVGTGTEYSVTLCRPVA